MLPVKEPDIEENHVPKVNFQIHNLWIISFLFIILSQLAYSRHIFDRVFEDRRTKRRAKWALWISVYAVLPLGHH